MAQAELAEWRQERASLVYADAVQQISLGEAGGKKLRLTDTVFHTPTEEVSGYLHRICTPGG